MTLKVTCNLSGCDRRNSDQAEWEDRAGLVKKRVNKSRDVAVGKQEWLTKAR